MAEPVTVAVLGAAGSFSETAARQWAGAGVELLRVPTFDALFEAVESGRAAQGVVPVRNSIAGPVFDNADRVRAGAFRVTGTLDVPVALCLVTRLGTTLREVRRVASHPVALRQCGRFLATLPGHATIAIGDTASGVRALMAGHLAADAVIASAAAAAIHGAAVLLVDVHDNPGNFTTFVVIARAGEPSVGLRTSHPQSHVQ